MANEVLFDVDEVKKGMDALETDFNNFAETLKGINDYMETMINAGADSAIFGDYGSKLYQIWSANASTFGDFHANFEAWSEVVAVISAEKADFVVDTAALYRDNGSTLDGVQGAREHVRENGRLGEYTGDDEAIKAVLANASQTEAGSGGTSSTTGVNEFGGVNEEDASGYTLIKDANGNVIAQYKDGGSMSLLKNYDEFMLDKIEHYENNIDKMESVVTKYLINLENLDLSERDNKKITSLLKIEAEYEKIGDYAYRLAKKFENINDSEITFSKTAIREMEVMYKITDLAIQKSIDIYQDGKRDADIEIEALRDFAEIRREKYKNLHIRRLKNGKCSVESGVSFLEILSCCESIINHCLNISIANSNISNNKSLITKHDYQNKMYNKHSKEIEDYINQYDAKYN